MTQNKLTPNIRCLNNKRRGGAEVISSILLVAVTVVGAVILTSFLDETFVAGSLGASSNSDSVIKSVKLTGFDTRDGGNLMGIQNLNNTIPTDQVLCRNNCTPNAFPGSPNNGTEFIVIQIENKGVNPIYMHNVYLDGVNHVWDLSTAGVTLTPQGSFNDGEFPGDGSFSIISADTSDLTQREDNQIINGETVNLIIKLDQINEDIPLGGAQ
jgi:hypothetical protein